MVDDLPSLEPFIARGIRIYGTAEDPIDRVGMVGPGHYVRVTPTISWSWNLDGAPAGDTWYTACRTVHQRLLEGHQRRDHQAGDTVFLPAMSAAVSVHRSGRPQASSTDRPPHNAGWTTLVARPGCG